MLKCCLHHTNSKHWRLVLVGFYWSPKHQSHSVFYHQPPISAPCPALCTNNIKILLHIPQTHSLNKGSMIVFSTYNATSRISHKLWKGFHIFPKQSKNFKRKYKWSLENTINKIDIALRLTDIKYDFAYHGNVVSEYRLHYHIVSILSTLLN